MNGDSPHRRLGLIFLLALLSTIAISPQLPLAFAGMCGSPEGDCDQDSFTPNEGDCDDYNPNVYPGHGSCAVPIEAINDVIIEVQDLAEEGDITSGQANALVAKLQNAINKIEADKISPAIGSLNAFINQVKALMSSGAMSSSVGQELIASVQSILDDLRLS
jgi:hypothetical protein